MRRDRIHGLVVGMLAAAVLWSRPALADGMIVTKTTNTQTMIRAFAQRAFLWHKNGTWELYLQALFDREQAEAAWIVPFPVRPEVSEADAALLDQLDLLTAPVFQERCEVASDRGGCWGTGAAGGDDGSGSSQLEAAKVSVKVWERGQVGQLDYVILSATDGDHLADWIQQNGYVLPEGAADKISALDTEGLFYFVAKLSAETDATSPMLVRFVLPEIDQPLYPLRLTSLMVQPNEALDLELFVATSPVEQYLPNGDFPVTEVPSAKDATSYQENLDQFFSTHASNELLLTYYDDFHGLSDNPGDTPRCSDEFYGRCTALSDVDIDLPETWAPEILQLRDQDYTIMRLEGRLDSTAMATDLVLEPVHDNALLYYKKSAVYVNFTGLCPIEPDKHVSSCSTENKLPEVPGWFLLLLGWTGWLGLRRQRWG